MHSRRRWNSLSVYQWVSTQITKPRGTKTSTSICASQIWSFLQVKTWNMANRYTKQIENPGKTICLHCGYVVHHNIMDQGSLTLRMACWPDSSSYENLIGRVEYGENKHELNTENTAVNINTHRRHMLNILDWCILDVTVRFNGFEIPTSTAQSPPLTLKSWS